MREMELPGSVKKLFGRFELKMESTWTTVENVVNGDGRRGAGEKIWMTDVWDKMWINFIWNFILIFSPFNINIKSGKKKKLDLLCKIGCILYFKKRFFRIFCYSNFQVKKSYKYRILFTSQPV